MIKRLIVALAIVCLTASVGFAGTRTTYFSLYKPALHETDWGTNVNTNWDTIDSWMNTATSATLVTGKAYVDGNLGVEGNATAQVLTVSGATTTNSLSVTTDTTIGRDISFQVATGNILSLTALDLTNNIFSVTDSSLTTGSLGYFYSNSADTSGRYLVNIINDNSAATGATALNIQQDANTQAFVIGYKGTTQTAMVINDNANITGGGLLSLYSNSNSGTARTLFSVTNDNTAGTGGQCVYVQQDAAQIGVYVVQSAANDALYCTSADRVALFYSTGKTSNVMKAYDDSLTTGSAGYFYSNSTDSGSTRSILNVTNDNTLADACDGISITQHSTASIIITSIGARLTSQGVWTNASCTFDEKENVAQVEPTNTIDKLKALKLYKYQKKSEVYGMKQDILSDAVTIPAPDEYNDRYEDVKDKDDKPTGEKKLVTHELKTKEHRKKVDDDEYVLDKDVYKKVVGKEYPKDKKNPNAKYYTGYVLDDPSTPEELISRDWNGHIEGISPQDGVNFLLAVNKELVARVETLEAKVAELEKKAK